VKVQLLHKPCGDIPLNVKILMNRSCNSARYPKTFLKYGDCRGKKPEKSRECRARRTMSSSDINESSPQIKQENDSCYDNPTDDEAEKPVENQDFHPTDSADVSPAVTESLSDDDEDSVDYVVHFDDRYRDPEGKIAFCCQNCK
jgi:hypothetical protein